MSGLALETATGHIEVAVCGDGDQVLARRVEDVEPVTGITCIEDIYIFLKDMRTEKDGTRAKKATKPAKIAAKRAKKEVLR